MGKKATISSLKSRCGSTKHYSAFTIVLGGIFLGHYRFTDIPAMTDEELKM
jgi:hypothetical protein